MHELCVLSAQFFYKTIKPTIALHLKRQTKTKTKKKKEFGDMLKGYRKQPMVKVELFEQQNNLRSIKFN